ncbi:MAG: ComEC/Rec2 family competence protein, partial [Chthoniobacterales bacterium]
MSDFESRTRGKFWKFRLPCAGLFLAAMAGVVLSECLPISAVLWLALGVAAGGLAFVPRLTWMLWVSTALVFGGMHAVQSRESPGNQLARAVENDVLETKVLVRVDQPFRASGGGSVPRWRAQGAVSLDAADEAIDARPNWIPVLLVWEGSDPPKYGDQLRAQASIRRIAAARNPGDFDARAWQRLSGVYCEALIEPAAGYEVVSSDPNPLILFALRARTKMIETLSIGIGGTLESSIILGMTIGDTRKMPDEIEDAFREAGVFHLFSVSGLHVGMIAGILWFLLGIAGVDKRKAALILIPCVFFYALVTGLKPASVRAVTMIAMVAGGLIFHRQPIALNSLCAAGLIILGVNTNELFNPGFQLSFGVVTAILLIALPLYRLIEIAVRPDPFIPRQLLAKWRIWLWDGGLAAGGLVSVSLAAWIGSLPLTIIYFNLVSFAAIPVNILIVPLAFVSLALAAGSVGVGWAVPFVADLLNHANLVVTKAIVGTVMAFTSVPGGHFYVAAPLPASTVAQITVMDFGSGGCTVIRTRDGVWLIDGGSS